MNGMGLSNITSRIDSINGSIEIKSQKGEGMSATASIETAAVDNTPKKGRRGWRER